MKKALIVKIGAIGDVILSLPMINGLKDFEITWIVGKIPSEILRCIKSIAHVITIDETYLSSLTFESFSFHSSFGIMSGPDIANARQ